ncbi:sorting nexin-29-like [Amphibalanus amphitrite]|uniref:sorting nexin-29-like n=1 Tax=Amphibalanus amphitrite TaxID=1232801 RepID=UPI001C909817|nr:sorting nexin-29-like [Amphibalanus amphitrite]
MDFKSEERQNLLSRLLDAVKQCQIRFGGKRELATDMDPRICCLCQQLEAVLQHGLRQPEASNTPFRQMRDAIAQNFSINLSGAPPEPPVFWHYVRLHLTRHEYERYLLLVNIHSDAGRGRAWLRSALNESSLERYLHALIGDREGMARFYEPWAVLADPEKNAMLPNIAAGLSSVLFAISIDRQELNGAARPRPRPPDLSAAPPSREPEAVVKAQSVDVRAARPGGRRRRRRVQAQVVSLDGDDAGSVASPSWRSAPATCVSSPAPAGGRHAFSFDGAGGEHDGSSRSEHSLPDASSGEDGTRSEEAGPEAPQQLRPCGGEAGDAASLTLQLDAVSDRFSASNGEPALPQPGALCNGLASSADSADDVRDLLEAAPSVSSGVGDHGTLPPGESSTTASLSERELREALVAVSGQKATLSEQVTELRAELDSVRQQRDALREAAEASSAVWEEKLAVLESKRLTSERENGILKHQLKNYVSAVQQLRHGSPHQILEELQREQRSSEEQALQRHDDYHAEAEAYQRKLIQVAEMHGELMEFNERLQRRLGRRERQLAALRTELAECGLSGAASDTSGSEGAPDAGDDEPPPPPPRVHCWIPAAFLSGSGNGAHHVYQVYIRIRDEEWNVYHRYSSFYLLYNKLKKEFSEVRQFDFPPKKTLNKKDGRLVEERRRKLQEFLRCVTRALLAGRAELARAPCRAALVAEEPFFGRSGAAGEQGGAAAGGRLSMFSRSAAPAAGPARPRYTGL